MDDTTNSGVWDEVCKRIDPLISDFLDKEFGMDITVEPAIPDRIGEFRRNWRNRQSS